MTHVVPAANPPGRDHTTMLPFWFGTLAGLAPWVVIAINVVRETGSNVLIAMENLKQAIAFANSLDPDAVEAVTRPEGVS